MNDSDVLRKNWDLYPELEYFMLTGNNQDKNCKDKKRDDHAWTKQNGLFVEIYFDIEKKDVYYCLYVLKTRRDY